MLCGDLNLAGTEKGSAQELRRIYRQVAGTLRRAGVPSPELDARLLICHACGLSHETFAAEPSSPISVAKRSGLDKLVERRIRREPVSRIVGQREFWSLPFLVAVETLDPRPDTELVVQTVLEIVHKRGTTRNDLKLLDLGAGCGCILISLLTELDRATGVGIDISEAALKTAQRNADALGVGKRAHFAVMDWLTGLSGQFDIVVCNPPYIRRDEIAGLAPEVAIYDPACSLDGGADGLAAYRAIIPFLKNVLASGGWAVFETGETQAADALALMRDNGIVEAADIPAIHHDLAGHRRVVVGQLCP